MYKYLNFYELSKNRKLIHLSILNIQFQAKTTKLTGLDRGKMLLDFCFFLIQNQGVQKFIKLKKYHVSLMRSHRPFILSHIFSCILSFLYLISLLFLSLLIFSFCNALHLVEKDDFKSLIHRSTKLFKSISSDWQITLLRPYSFHIKNGKTGISPAL